ncbi:MAG: helix-turn-helix domain-containing protein [Solirubrobacteraceae bacterium]
MPTRVHLLEVEPDLAAALPHDEREVVQRLTAPVITLDLGALSLEDLADETEAFAAIILDGIILNHLGAASKSALRLLGPGDLLTLPGSDQISWLEISWEVPTPARLVLLDDHFLAAVRQFPRLVSGLQARVAEQLERLSAQMVICQLPRVGDRVLALLWLLAESWGRVTASGTAVPIELTHDTIGELIGARRSTVTLAVSELSERGALIRGSAGWLLLERPPNMPTGRHAPPPTVTPREPSVWEVAGPPSTQPPVVDLEQTIQTIAALREQHLESIERFRDGLERVARSRALSHELRERTSEARLTRQQRRRERQRTVT